MHNENQVGTEQEAQTIAATDVGNLADVLTPESQALAEHVPDATIAPPAAPPLSGTELILRLIGQIEELRRSVDHGFGTAAFIAGVADRLAKSEVLAPLIDRLIMERLTLMTQGAQPAAPAVPRIVGLRAVLFVNVEDETNRDLKVQRLDASHPTNPGGIEAYLRDDDHWHVSALGDLAADAIKLAMDEIQAPAGQFYWVEFFQITDLPVPGLVNQRLDAAGNIVEEPAVEETATTESAPESAMQSTDSPTA